MKKTEIVMLIITLVATIFMTGMPVVGIVEALAIGPIAEVYPAIVFFGMCVIFGIMAITHVIYELLMEVTKKES